MKHAHLTHEANYRLFVDGESCGAVETYDDAAEIALFTLKPGQRLEMFRGESRSPSARWVCDETGKVKRVMA